MTAARLVRPTSPLPRKRHENNDAEVAQSLTRSRSASVARLRDKSKARSGIMEMAAIFSPFCNSFRLIIGRMGALTGSRRAEVASEREATNLRHRKTRNEDSRNRIVSYVFIWYSYSRIHSPHNIAVLISVCRNCRINIFPCFDLLIW